MDINKAIETLAWPAVFLLCVTTFLVVFRVALNNLINRVRRMGYGDKAIDLGEAPQPAAEQQKKLEAAPKVPEPVPTAPPPANLVIAPIEGEIDAALKAANLSNELERAWLVRTVALLRVARAHEIAYRLIVGSQLSLLLQANTANPPTMIQAQQIYDAAKTVHPDVYRAFPFETWLHWPVNSGLLKIELAGADQVLRITPIGQDFLHYLVDNSLTSPKYG